MTNHAPLRLPAHLTGQQPTGAPDTLRTMRPRFLAPSPTDPTATAHAVGSNIVRLPPGFEARASALDGVPVLFARNGKEVHLLVDSVGGVVEIDGLSAEQTVGIRDWLDAAAAAPEHQTELDTFMSKIGERTGGRPIEGKHLSASEAARLGKLHEATRLGLSASTDPMIDTYAATKGITASSADVDRLVALAATLDDGAASGDGEVNRLVRMAGNLSDG